MTSGFKPVCGSLSFKELAHIFLLTVTVIAKFHFSWNLAQILREMRQCAEGMSYFY